MGAGIRKTDRIVLRRLANFPGARARDELAMCASGGEDLLRGFVIQSVTDNL